MAKEHRATAIATTETSRVPGGRPHRAGCAEHPGEPATPRSQMGRRRALVLIGVHLVIAVRIALWRLEGRAVSPLEPSEAGLLASEGVLTAGFIFFVLLILSTLVFGRFFCGWGCHVVALQDASGYLLKRMGLAPRPLRSRLLAFVPWIGALELFLAPALLRAFEGAPFPALRVHLTTEDFWARFPGLGVALLTFFVVGFLCVWFLGAKGFCTYACPYGALFGAAERYAPGRIRVSDACEGCGHCTAVCTSNVRVHEEVRRFGMVVDAGCMKCMDCVSACPKEALSFGFGPRAKPKPAAEPQHKRYDFSWPEELASLLLFLLGLYAFRNLYGLVPFLLALALGVLLALAVALAWRLALLPELTFQHWTLKHGGRLQRAGFVALLPLVGFPALAGHSTWLQWHAREGQRLLNAAARAEGEPRAALLERARSALQSAASAGFLVTPELDHRLGAILLEQGDLELAREHLERAREQNPHSLAILEQLASLELRAGRFPELARNLARSLAELAERDPESARSRAQELAPRAIELVQNNPQADAPVLLLCWIQALLGDNNTARENAAKQPREGADWRALERWLER